MSDQLKTEAEIAQWFESNGWVEWTAKHERCDRNWFKKFPDEPKCKTNEPKPLQVRAMMFDRRRYGASIGVQLELVAEPFENDGWVSLSAYGFELSDIPKQVERLLVGWRAICAS